MLPSPYNRSHGNIELLVVLTSRKIDGKWRSYVILISTFALLRSMCASLGALGSDRDQYIHAPTCCIRSISSHTRTHAREGKSRLTQSHSRAHNDSIIFRLFDSASSPHTHTHSHITRALLCCVRCTAASVIRCRDFCFGSQSTGDRLIRLSVVLCAQRKRDRETVRVEHLSQSIQSVKSEKSQIEKESNTPNRPFP